MLISFFYCIISLFQSYWTSRKHTGICGWVRMPPWFTHESYKKVFSMVKFYGPSTLFFIVYCFHPSFRSLRKFCDLHLLLREFIGNAQKLLISIFSAAAICWTKYLTFVKKKTCNFLFFHYLISLEQGVNWRVIIRIKCCKKSTF